MFLEKDGKGLYYEVHGEGDPALLFVHGWMASSAVWREQVGSLSGKNKVVTFDLTGYGQSAKPGDIAYTPDVWLDDLDALIGYLHLAKPVLIGWSMGAAIGIAYAVTRPDALSKLVIVGGTPLLVAPSDVFEYATPPEAAEQLAGGLQSDFSTGARGFVEMMFPEPGTEDLKNEVHAITQQTTAPIALESVNNAGSADLRPMLAGVNVPTLVLHGEADNVCPLGAGQCLADMIPNAEFATFSGKGHLPFLTDPVSFNDRLRAFIGAQ